MKPIPYIDRQTGTIAFEKVYGGKAVSYLYNGSWIGNCLRNILSKNSFVSSLLGFWHKQRWTKRHIAPFVKEYEVNPEEFLDPSFDSFNAFFIRKLKPEVRPIAAADAIIPADARYWFYEQMDDDTDFIVKGERLNRKKLLGQEAHRFERGAVVIARLCPSDYHRFHFPIDCIPGKPHLINGPLFSVNPLAIKQNISHLTENKRMVTYLEHTLFGHIAFLEIGATSVGSIKETFIPDVPVLKGAEKGYFEFGGSALLLLFEPYRITFSEDLLAATEKGIEIRCLMGQPMGKVKDKHFH